jgi:hypothetical protein
MRRDENLKFLIRVRSYPPPRRREDPSLFLYPTDPRKKTMMTSFMGDVEKTMTLSLQEMILFSRFFIHILQQQVANVRSIMLANNG